MTTTRNTFLASILGTLGLGAQTQITSNQTKFKVGNLQEKVVKLAFAPGSASFTLPDVPISLKLFRNGLLQSLPDDYTLNSNAINLKFPLLWDVTDIVQAIYYL